jgi:transcriptional regulator of arginine metabolism
MARHHLIRQLLSDGPVPSQDELRRQLAGEGVEVTQGTLSRDLKNLGVIKGPQGYTLPGEPGVSPPPPSVPNESALQGTVRLNVVSVETASNLVVLRTGPGHAQLVALALDADRAKTIEGLVGTVAGDDTIFIAVRSAKLADSAASRLREWAGLTPPRRKRAS